MCARLLYDEIVIPIVSLTHLISVFVSGALALHLFRQYQQNPSLKIKLFAWFYFLFAISWLIAATPGIFSDDARHIAIFNIISFAFIYASVAVAIYIPFSFLERHTLGLIAVVIVIIGGIIFTVGRIFYFQNSVVEYIPPFVYWKPVFRGWLRFMTGAINAAASLVFIAIFLSLGIRNRIQHIVYYRSIALAAGMSVLFVATIVVQLVATPTFLRLATGAILVASGLLLMAHGIMHEHKTISRNGLPE